MADLTWDETGTQFWVDGNGPMTGPEAAAIIDTQRQADLVALEDSRAAVSGHRDRLGSDAALTRLREIRDDANTFLAIQSPSNAQIAARVSEAALAQRDLAKWAIEESKWLTDRKGESEG